jgi:peptidoglycan/LPS O-acetylase OafA/YrhL
MNDTLKARAILGLELSLGVAAVAGGGALIAVPSGSALSIKSTVLAHTVFTDFRVPGILLAVCVGGGGLGAAWLTHRRPRHWRACSAGYALGLVLFEVIEEQIIGWQPLQAVVAALALVILVLLPTSGPSRNRSGSPARRGYNGRRMQT